MTSTTCYTADAADSDPPPGTRSKTSLFCPDCGHESPVTGDWTIEATEPNFALRCPDCDALVQQR